LNKRTDKALRAILQFVVTTKPRYLHLGFWGLLIFEVAFAARAAEPPSVPRSAVATIALLLALILAVATAAILQKFLRQWELWVVRVQALTMVATPVVAIVINVSAWAGLPQGLLVPLRGLAATIFVVAFACMYLTYYVVGRAVCRARRATGEEQVTDSPLTFFFLFQLYFILSASLLNPMIRSALRAGKE
jgi:hypothetical protein